MTPFIRDPLILMVWLAVALTLLALVWFRVVVPLFYTPKEKTFLTYVLKVHFYTEQTEKLNVSARDEVEAVIQTSKIVKSYLDMGRSISGLELFHSFTESPIRVRVATPPSIEDWAIVNIPECIAASDVVPAAINYTVQTIQ
jgi:hypothetical protein